MKRNFPGKTGYLALFIVLLHAGSGLDAQEVPAKPFSIPVYNPMVLNPAFAGSKDFTNISLTTRALKYPDSQVLNYHQRLKSARGDFSPLGIGSYLFQEQYEDSWNTGFALAGAYHYALDKDRIHNLAAGVSLKGIIAVPRQGEEALFDSLSTVFIPNADFGIYYYGPSAFAGLSSTNLFQNVNGTDSTQSYALFNREYHFYGGYKFLVSKRLGIVIEPSVLLSLNDGTFGEAHKHLVPYLKVYLQSFYIGTYLKDFDTLALFFQYQFPVFYAGVFLEFPRVGYLNNENIIFEVSVGVNLGRSGSSFLHYRHW